MEINVQETRGGNQVLTIQKQETFGTKHRERKQIDKTKHTTQKTKED